MEKPKYLSFTDVVGKRNLRNLRKRAEPYPNDIRELAKKDPGRYCHQIMSHGFMDYLEEREIDEFRAGEKSLKKEFVLWAKANGLKRGLIESGWQEFLDD